MQCLILNYLFFRSTFVSWLIMSVKDRASSIIQQPEISEHAQKQDILIEAFLGFSSPSQQIIGSYLKLGPDGFLQYAS